MTKHECINLKYKNTHQMKVMKKMHINRDNPITQMDWVEKYSPKEEVYVCGNCPSWGLCRFVNRYGLRDSNN